MIHIEVLKWVSTAILVVGAFVNSLGIYPLGVIVLLIGSVFWTFTAWLMKDKALFTNNIVLTVLTFSGLCIAHFS